MAKRVTESIMSMTSAPASRKLSAIVVAVSAALMRTRAGWSDVATTTTERSIASPRSRSMNSRTSRPRSPTRQMTFTSADVERAIMPMSDDLPTPEPAKMPRRWPWPHGTSESRARTPSEMRSWMRGRVSGSGGDALAGRRGVVSAISPRPSIGRPRPSRTRPSRSMPTGTSRWRPIAVTGLPGPMPAISPSGMSSVRRARKPTTSAGTGGRPRPVPISQTSPTSTSRPEASTMSPIRSETRPWRRCRSARPMAPDRSPRRSRRSAAIAAASDTSTEFGDDDVAGPGELGLQRGVDLALRGAHDGAPTADAALGLHVAALDAAEAGHELRRRSAHGLHVLGVDEDRHAVALRQPAQRAAHGVDDALRIDVDGRAHRLLGDAQAQDHGPALDPVGDLGAQLGDRGQRGPERLGAAGQLGLRGL